MYKCSQCNRTAIYVGKIQFCEDHAPTVKKNQDEDFIINAELAAMEGYPYDPEKLPEQYKHLKERIRFLNEIHKKHICL